MANNNNSNSNNTRIQHHITAKLYKLKMIVIIGWPLGASVYDTTKTKMTPTTETKRLQHALTAFCTVCRNTVGRLVAPRLPGFDFEWFLINSDTIFGALADQGSIFIEPSTACHISAVNFIVATAPIPRKANQPTVVTNIVQHATRPTYRSEWSFSINSSLMDGQSGGISLSMCFT